MKPVHWYTIAVLLTLAARFARLQSAVYYNTEEYVVRYHAGALPSLKVYQNKHLVWFSSPTESHLVSAAMVDQSYTQTGGSFVFPDNRTLSTCTEAEIKTTGIDPSSKAVYLQGNLCSKVSFSIHFKAIHLKFQGTEYSYLDFSVEMVENSFYNQIRFTYGCERDEQFYGFGAQYSKFNMKGVRLPVFLSEQGVGRGLQPLTKILDALSPGAGKPKSNVIGH